MDNRKAPLLHLEFDKLRRPLLLCCILLCIVFLTTCKKDPAYPQSATVIDLHTSLHLNDISFDGQNGFVAGGIAGNAGSIWRTRDGGASWEIIFDTSACCMYDVEFLDQMNGYAGGDALCLLRTNNGGDTWTPVFKDTDFSSWQEFVKPIRRIQYINPWTIIAAGGDTWYKGLICISHNWGQNWAFQNFDNQLNDVEMLDSHHVWLCGYGIFMSSSDSCNTLQSLDFREDFFTACDFSNALSGLACGYNGGIYLTMDGGNSWTEVLKSNNTFDKRQHFNDICYLDEHSAIAAGNNGLLMISTDAGLNWQPMAIDASNDILSIAPKTPTEIWISGTNGFLCQIILN